MEHSQFDLEMFMLHMNRWSGHGGNALSSALGARIQLQASQNVNIQGLLRLASCESSVNHHTIDTGSKWAYPVGHVIPRCGILWNVLYKPDVHSMFRTATAQVMQCGCAGLPPGV